MSAPLPTVSRILLPKVTCMSWISGKKQKMELILDPLRGFPKYTFSFHSADEPLQPVHKPDTHSTFQNKSLQVVPVGPVINVYIPLYPC